MSIERRPINSPQREHEARGPASTATELSLDVVGCVTCISATEPNTPVNGSHPGLLELARILGRSAARAELRRTRRGAMPLMGPTDALLLATVIVAAVLMWSVVMVLR